MSQNALNQPLAELDPDIAAVLAGELTRQRETLEMIASENFVPRAVLEATGSVLTNKYAEGYPGKRYYGGCEQVDIAENLAITRAKELFGADYANVQPHSGATANAAVLHAMATPGDPIMGLSLAHGGPLRLIVPGYQGVNNIKYIKRLAFTEAQSQARIMQHG